MTALIIIAAILALLLIILLIPLKLRLSFSEAFDHKVSYAGIKLLPKKGKPEEQKNEIQPEQTEQKQENLIKKLYRENDFSTFLKIVLDFLKTVFAKLKYILKHIKIRKLCLNVIIASDDAATTGINYGIVCSVLYTFLEILESAMNVELKKIDVNADFEAKKTSFSFSTVIMISPLYLIIAAAVIIKKYIQITNIEGSVSNERK